MDEQRFSVLGGDAEAIAHAARGGAGATASTWPTRCSAAVGALAGPDRTLDAPTTSRSRCWPAATAGAASAGSSDDEVGALLAGT